MDNLISFVVGIVVALVLVGLPMAIAGSEATNDLAQIRQQAVERGYAEWCVDRSFAWKGECK